MKRIILIVTTFFFSMVFWAQNLDKMKEPEKKEALLRIAKEIIMEYGPDYYREYGEPEIKRGIAGKDDIQRFSLENEKKYKNKVFYTVKYFYNKNEEAFRRDYSAYVFIWGDTGEAFKVYFGGGLGRTIDSKRTKSNTEKSTWKKQPPGAFKTTIVRKLKEGEIPEGDTPDIPKKWRTKKSGEPGNTE
ncbi:hypothetical protein [Dysgonomonas mossii]|uniref:hypothetical protein n=1 Tax=Dysgonomonas mossii TaxID=163665 RepID=UPI0039911C64